MSAFDAGFVSRQELFCSDSVDKKKIVPLSGRIFTELRSLEAPIPSGLDINLQFFRNKDDLIIMHKTENEKFRLTLEYFECYLQRVIVLPEIHVKVEERLKNGEKLKYFFQRTESTSQILTGGVLRWESSSLFAPNNCPPYILVFFQSQLRILGDLTKSPQRFELPGLFDDNGKPRLKTLEFLLDGNSLQRYFSSTQADIDTGIMLHWYIQVFEILGAYYTERSTNLTFEEFKKFFTIWSFSTVPSGVAGKHEVPLVRSGRCSIQMTFNEPIPTDTLQQMVVLSISPALMEIDFNRKILCSFRTG